MTKMKNKSKKYQALAMIQIMQHSQCGDGECTSSMHNRMDICHKFNWTKETWHRSKYYVVPLHKVEQREKLI